jgi:hypothetical protein
MKVECTDLMDPRLVCVGTISRVVGRLLKVRHTKYAFKCRLLLTSQQTFCFTRRNFTRDCALSFQLKIMQCLPGAFVIKPSKCNTYGFSNKH